MLTIKVCGTELFRPATSDFVDIDDCELTLAHSLVSISKWESKVKKSFFLDTPKTPEENLEYIKCMTVNKVDPNVYLCLSRQNISDINDYISDTCTATTFTNRRKSNDYGPKLIITSELIYYWMIFYDIPFECEKWNINRLLVLINICRIKSSENNKMSMNDIYGQQNKINAMRRKAMHR